MKHAWYQFLTDCNLAKFLPLDKIAAAVEFEKALFKSHFRRKRKMKPVCHLWVQKWIVFSSWSYFSFTKLVTFSFCVWKTPSSETYQNSVFLVLKNKRQTEVFWIDKLCLFVASFFCIQTCCAYTVYCCFFDRYWIFSPLFSLPFLRHER